VVHSAKHVCISTKDFDYYFIGLIILAQRIFWGFDGSLQDLYNNFNGYGNNSPTYQSPGYNGAGSCIYLNRASSQAVTIFTPPFLNMAYTSFTLEAWMYAQTLCTGSTCTDNALFGQYDQNVLDHSLHIIVRNQRIYLGFFADDAVGNQVSEHYMYIDKISNLLLLFYRFCLQVHGIIWYVSIIDDCRATCNLFFSNEFFRDMFMTIQH
jgi:hypothetical protein